MVAARRGVFYSLAVLLSAVAIALAAEAAYRAKLAVDVQRYAADTPFDLYGLGESTMVGEPFEPKISVPRLLERMFAGSIAGRPIVITNLAERGAPLYPQSAAFERALASRNPGAPGVVLIMSGHNEAFMDAAPGTWRPYVPSFIADRSAIVRVVRLRTPPALIGRERSPAGRVYLRRVIETAQATASFHPRHNGVPTSRASSPTSSVRTESVVRTIDQVPRPKRVRTLRHAISIFPAHHRPSAAALYTAPGSARSPWGTSPRHANTTGRRDRDPLLLFVRARRGAEPARATACARTGAAGR